MDRSRKRILHICNWYPNIFGPGEVPFIRRHVSSLEPHFRNDVWHIEVRRTTGKNRFTKRSLHADRTFLAEIRTDQWRILEWLTFLTLIWAWMTRDRSQKFDLINIHIAYPLAVQLSFLKRLFKVPIVITEQWSAYHYSFNSTSKGLRRIKRIFHQNTPLICVSKALKEDIEKFSGKPQEQVAIVDNVADSTVFHWQDGSMPVEGRYFAIAGWRFPKRPIVLIEMMADLKASGLNAVLRLAGNGPMVPAMEERIKSLGLEDRIMLLGQLGSAEVAAEMRSAHALLHCSDYETYSAVCAESLCVGTPVIASQVGGIKEYMTAATGSLVADNDAISWYRAVKDSWYRTLSADRQNISRYMIARASTHSVGSRYAAFLNGILDQRNVT